LDEIEKTKRLKNKIEAKKNFGLIKIVGGLSMTLLLIIAFLYILNGFSDAKDSLTENELIHARSSVEKLTHEVLELIHKKDVESLEKVALSEDEFKRYIWPEVPWSRPEMNMPFSYYWGDHSQKSYWALRRVLEEHGGKKYKLVRVNFAKGERDYKNVKLYGDTRLIVKDENGQEKKLNIFGSILELKGKKQFKLLSYIHD
jgi:hypothetical protein